MAGVLTHLPGLIYLAALNAIVGSATDAVDGLLQVLVYNAIWFSLPVVALLLSVRRPDTTRDLLERLRTWSRDNRRVVTVVFLVVLGTYLVVSGLNELTGGPAPRSGTACGGRPARPVWVMPVCASRHEAVPVIADGDRP